MAVLNIWCHRKSVPNLLLLAIQSIFPRLKVFDALLTKSKSLFFTLSSLSIYSLQDSSLAWEEYRISFHLQRLFFFKHQLQLTATTKKLYKEKTMIVFLALRTPCNSSSLFAAQISNKLLRVFSRLFYSSRYRCMLFLLCS